jgi:hypothetical protein
VQAVAAKGEGNSNVVRTRQSVGKTTYFVPAKIVAPFAILPEVITDTEEWLAQYATAEAPAAPIQAPGSGEIN